MYKRNWYKISAGNKILGRLATRAAVVLMGKNKADFIRHEDKGDFLVITDAEKVKVSGNKQDKKMYFIPSRYPGNSKFISYNSMQEKKPENIIYHAVKGMLPKNKLGSRMLTRLKIYTGNEHPHFAQQPINMENENGKNE